MGFSVEQVSLQKPSSFTWPSGQHIPPISTLPNEHLPQTPATSIGLAGGQVSLQTPLSLTSPSLQQIPPISTSLNWHLLQAFSVRSQCGFSDGQ